jgi:DNA polymerase-4
MEVDAGIKWLFLDLNSYFASVEQQDNPSLRGRPVAVVPMESDGTCAIAASYEAKAYGVKTGTKIYEAKRMCPGLVCVPARHDIYVQYHHRILEEVLNHILITKVCSVDELSSKLPNSLCDIDAARAMAQRLKEGIWRNIGPAISCSIGLAPNAFLAKIATDMQKPNGLVILQGRDLPGRLFDLELTDLPGINVRMEERLRRGGIKTIEEFWNISPKHARKVWGSVQGERFWYRLHGYDLPEIETQTSMIGHSRVLDWDLRAPDTARQVTRRLATKAASRLRRKDFYATRFVLGVRLMDGRRWGGEMALSPAQDNFSFLKALDILWARMVAAHRPDKLKKVSVALVGLCKREEITPDLFDVSSETFQKSRQKNETLSSIIDAVNKRYGAESLTLGVSPKTKTGYVGTKIAFSRIPDQAEFWE